MPRAPHSPFPPTILVVDDDLGARDLAKRVLNAAGFEVDGAASGREAAAVARSRGFDLIVALEKPVSADALLAIVRSALEAQDPSGPPLAVPLGRRESRKLLRSVCPGSAAERWARHVANACASEGDLKTLGIWAKFIGVSYSSLCESCRMLGIRPRDARDFARMLRALVQAAAHHCSPLVLLDVSDRRTLRNLVERTGLRSATTVPVSVEPFFDAQRLIPCHHEGVKLLRSLFSPGDPRRGDVSSRSNYSPSR
jgi:DNA-binding NarL/FixJ family response regulator